MRLIKKINYNQSGLRIKCTVIQVISKKLKTIESGMTLILHLEIVAVQYTEYKKKKQSYWEFTQIKDKDKINFLMKVI
jgi:hypothetical protein